MMRVFLGSDHRGFKLKEQIKQWLITEGYEAVDKGNMKFDAEDDFPDFGLAVAEEVSEGTDVGILFCGSGGMALAANKVRGIRAVEVYDVERAIHAKAHDKANIISIPADMVGFEKTKEIIKAWLEAELKQEEKYGRRLKKIEEIEKKYFK